jgi:hypothetical protein
VYLAGPRFLDGIEMNDREKVLTLNRIAFLDALIFSFLGIQFVIPLAFILLLIIIPTIIALQFYHMPIKHALLSGLLLLVLTFALFGISIALWELLYFVVGGAIGIGWRFHIHILLRLLLATIVFVISLLVIAFSFGALAQVSWQDIISLMARYPWALQVPWIPIILVGLSIWAMLLSLGVENLLSRVLKQLYIGRR